MNTELGIGDNHGFGIHNFGFFHVFVVQLCPNAGAKVVTFLLVSHSTVESWKRYQTLSLWIESPGLQTIIRIIREGKGTYLRFASFNLDISRGPASPSSRPLQFLPSSTLLHFQIGVNLSGIFSSWFLTYWIWVIQSVAVFIRKQDNITLTLPRIGRNLNPWPLFRRH